MAKKCARTFSIVVEKGKKSILDVSHLLPDALPRSVRLPVKSLHGWAQVHTGLIGHEPGEKSTSRNGSVSCYPTLLPSPKRS